MVFDKPLQKSSEKLLNSLCGRLRVKYGEKEFYFCDSTGLIKSAAYRTTGRYTYSVMYFNRVEGDEICLMFPIKEWSAEFFEKLEDKIIKTLDFCVAKTKEEE